MLCKAAAKLHLSFRIQSEQLFISGSWCRCYELKCDTGTVIGNYSASGVATPYNTSGGFQSKVNLSTVVDDYNRSWPGNTQLGSQQLFTQCWNLTQVVCHPILLITQVTCPASAAVGAVCHPT